MEKIHAEIREVMGKDIGFNIIVDQEQNDEFNPEFENKFRGDDSMIEMPSSVRDNGGMGQISEAVADFEDAPVPSTPDIPKFNQNNASAQMPMQSSSQMSAPAQTPMQSPAPSPAPTNAYSSTPATSINASTPMQTSGQNPTPNSSLTDMLSDMGAYNIEEE